MRIVIDPGQSGAIAYRLGSDVFSYNCPETQRDMLDLVEDIKSKAPSDVRGIIEKVGPMPAQGVHSVWVFGANYASWQMAFLANGLSFKEVIPQKWMKFISGVPKDKTERKNFLKAYSQKIYPRIKVTLANADALAMLDVFDRAWDA